MTEIKDDGKSKKTWCITWNNYTEENIQKLKDLEGFNLLTIGKEVGESGTPHLQVSITFKRACRWSQLKRVLKSPHIELAINPDWAHNYCIKDDKYIRIDNRTQGARNDLKDIAKNIAVKGLRETIFERPDMYIKYHAGMEKLNAVFVDFKRDFKPIVYWLYGDTGTGKTRYVIEHEPDLWMSGKNLEWWQGYNGQKATVFDDFRKDFCTFHELLRIIDRYPYTVMVKGGSRELCSERMYITTPYSPQDTYETREDVKQLLRRIDYIIHFDKRGGVNYIKSPVTDVTDVTEVEEGNTILPQTSEIIYKKKTLCFD